MKCFQEWIEKRQFNEILELTAKNYPDVKLVGGAGSFRCKFFSTDNDGHSNEYSLAMSDMNHTIFQRDPDTGIRSDELEVNSWDISLYGPQGWNLTHNANATDVYGKMLYGIKLFFDKVDPNTIYFSPFEHSMALIYKRFFDKFLGDKFVQVDEGTFMRKEYIKTLSNDKREFINKRAEVQKKHTEEQLQSIRTDKVRLRKEALRRRANVGKIMRLYRGSSGNTVGLIVGVSSDNKYRMIVVNYGWSLEMMNVYDYSVDSIPMDMLQDYAVKIKTLVEKIPLRYPEYRALLDTSNAKETLNKVTGDPVDAPRPGIIIPPGLRDVGRSQPLRQRRRRGPAPEQLALFQ